MECFSSIVRSLWRIAGGLSNVFDLERRLFDRFEN